MGIYAVLMLLSAVKKQITAETAIVKVRPQAYKEGIKPLRVSGALKFACCVTTFDEVMRVAPPAGGGGRAFAAAPVNFERHLEI